MILLMKKRTHQVYGKDETAFLREGQATNSVAEVLNNYKDLLHNIPEEERYNIQFTFAHVEEGNNKRTFVSQEVIPFDIDGIDHSRLEEYIDITLGVLKLTREQVAIVLTGNGIHLLVQVPMFDDPNVFKELRPAYKNICSRIDKKFQEAFLVGDADPAIWSAGRMGRLPETANIKKDKADTMVSIYCNNLTPTNFSLAAVAPEEVIAVSDQVSPKALERMPKPDTAGVLDGCLFLKYAKNNQGEIKEPQWYAMLSIVGRLDNGIELCHTYSDQHHSYNRENTDYKIEQAVFSSGPRTCENINAVWGGCASCPKNGKIKSPIMIKGAEHIATEDAGFRRVKINKDGTVSAGKPDYDDMVKHFGKIHDYITIIDTRQVWIFNGAHWVPMERVELEAFAETILAPKPNNAERSEFVSKLVLYNLKSQDFFETDGMMNLQNGVLDIETNELIEHTPEYGFRYTIPFDYDPTAPCERFDKFMGEITLEDTDLTNLILEYIGYCLSGCPAYKGEKAMILLGDGSNGKSVLLDVIKFLAGKEAYAAISMADIQNEQHRYQLVGKLFNVSEETPRRALVDSSMFKNLITGGEMTVKKVYQPPFSVSNHCKFIFAANDLPDASDKTTGLFRRLLIAPFRAEFTGQQIDRKIRQKLQAEASGILNRVIEGYRRLAKNDYHFTESVEANESKEVYTSEENGLGDWIKYNLKYDVSVEGSFVADIYNEYKSSMEMAGAESKQIENYIEFSRRIGPELRVDYAKLKSRKRKGGLSVTYIKHVVLNKTDDDEVREF